MRTEVVGCKAQADNQPFVSEDLLFVAEDRICELRVESREGLGFGVARLHNRDVERIVGIARPCVN